jgi:PadR family transcriptional regulator AphA
MGSSIPSLTEYAILGLVSYGETSGYDLARLAERSVGLIWAPSRSQIYKSLGHLEELALVRGRRIAQQTRPDKTLFRLTAAGRRALEAWLRSVDDRPPTGRVTFPLKLYFCSLVGPEIALLHLAAYQRYLDRSKSELEAVRLPAASDPYTALVWGHGARRLEATQSWIRRAERALRGAAQAVTRAPPSNRGSRP